jgi:hypothetical protein
MNEWKKKDLIKMFKGERMNKSNWLNKKKKIKEKMNEWIKWLGERKQIKE